MFKEGYTSWVYDIILCIPVHCKVNIECRFTGNGPIVIMKNAMYIEIYQSLVLHLTYLEVIGGTINVNCCGGTLLHSLALVTIASASIAPNPNCELTLIPAPFIIHSLALSPFISTSELDVYTIRYCTSRQVRDGLKGNFQTMVYLHYTPSIECACIH